MKRLLSATFWPLHAATTHQDEEESTDAKATRQQQQHDENSEFLFIADPKDKSNKYSNPQEQEEQPSKDDAIPPPDHFDNPVDLSVVVSWVEDIFSKQWGVLDDVEPLFYHYGMGYTQVALCVSPVQQNIYVTFRGTDIMEFPDVLANLNILWDNYGPPPPASPHSYPRHDDDGMRQRIQIPGRVQRGWNRKIFNPRLYLPLSDELLKVKQKYPDYQVIVAGHSLGGRLSGRGLDDDICTEIGSCPVFSSDSIVLRHYFFETAALSILYGIYVAKYVLPDEKVQVINLGAPRVGDEEFYHSVQKIRNLTIWRMVFRDDIVPRCPPMWLGYRHVGHMLHWDKDDNAKAYHQQLESCMDSHCYAGIHPRNWNLLFGKVSDHAHDNYKCVVEMAKKCPEKYWPDSFEMLDPNKEAQNMTSSEKER